MEKQIETAATAIERGITKAVKKILLWLTGAYFAVVVIGWTAGDYKRDDTDGAERSGMKPHVDAATGCQYLSVAGGGITPRLNADGQHMGCRQL